MSFAQPFSDYEILERLGAGAMGTVFKARHKKLGRTVALKILRPSLARNERFVDRLRREARIVASLNHPNIVTGYDLGEEGGYHFFVMEYVEGRSLRQLLAEWGMFPEDQVLNVAMQVARALDHAYQKGVIHRDVKPGNILIDEQGRVKLTDMGLAKGPADLTLTRDGATVGTPQYISPEQARNPQEVDIRSDLYSLGATLYHMATGQSPFRGDTMAEVITKVLHERAPSATEINPRLSDGLSLVIRKLLAKDISLRYQTPAELLSDLERVERDERPDVDRVRLDAADAGIARGARRTVLLAIAAVVLIALSLLVGFLIRGGEDGDAAGAQRVLQLMEERLEGLRGPKARLAFLRRYEEDHRSLRDRIRLRADMILEEVQQEVDAVARSWLESRRGELEAWLNDEKTWPTAEDFERLRLVPDLLDNADFRWKDLPPEIDRSGLERLMEFVREEVRERDRNLLAKFEDHLGRELREAWKAHLEERDFAAAATVVSRAMGAFFGGDHPLPGRLEKETRAEAERLYETARKEALSEIDSAEQRLARRMQQRVEDGLSELERLLAGETEDPRPVARELDRLENDLRGGYPPPASFRPEQDPWPDLEGRFDSFEARLRLAAAAWQQARLESYLAIAYRALERGRPKAALDYLSNLVFQEHDLAQDLHMHRQWLAAAEAVLRPVLETLSSANEPLECRLRAEPMADLELRVVPGESGYELAAKLPGGEFRGVVLGDLWLQDLVEQATRMQPGLLDDLSPLERERGLQILAWLGDDPSAPGDAFAKEEVVPRLARARAERKRTGGEDPRTSLERVLQAQLRAAAGGDLGKLEEALRYHRLHHADATLGEKDQLQLEEHERWLDSERRRRKWLADLQRQAPSGVRANVRLDEEELEAEVAYPGTALHSFAAEHGWEPAGQRLAFVRGDVTLDALARYRLEVVTGLPAAAAELSCTVDLVLPQGRSGPGLWLFEFQGVLLAVALRGDDRVVTAVTETSTLSSPELLKRELQSALKESFENDGNGAGHARLALPGAIHRLRLESVRSSSRSRIGFRALLDDDVVADWSRSEHEAPAQAILRLYPMHPIELEQVAFRARGL